MDFVSDSLSGGPRLKYLTVADDFSHESEDRRKRWILGSGMRDVRECLAVIGLFGTTRQRLNDLLFRSRIFKLFDFYIHAIYLAWPA